MTKKLPEAPDLWVGAGVLALAALAAVSCYGWYCTVDHPTTRQPADFIARTAEIETLCVGEIRAMTPVETENESICACPCPVESR